MTALRGRVLAVTACCALAACGGEDPGPEPAEDAVSSAAVTPTSAVPEGVDVTELDAGPVGLARVGSAVWAALPDAGAVHGAHGRDVEVGTAPLRVASTPQGVWVSVIGDGALVRLDPRTGTVDKRVRMRPAGSEPEGLAYDGETVWVVDQAGDRVVPLDPATGKLGSPIPVGHEPRLATVGPDGTVFVANFTAGSVTRILDDDVATRSTGPDCTSPQGLAVAAGAVWVACTDDDTVVALDGESLRHLTTIRDVEFADAVVADGDTVYAVGQEGPTVWTIDGTRHTVLGSLTLDEAGIPNENVGAVVVGDRLVVSHPSSLRLYDVPLDLLDG